MRQTVDTVLGRKAGADELITVDAGAMVSEAVQIMAERHIGAVLIKNEDGLVDGIFTERDLLTRVVNVGRDAEAHAHLDGHDPFGALRDAGHHGGGGAGA
jgi:CBS domain-containing protein